jgi:hypothetical protein
MKQAKPIRSWSHPCWARRRASLSLGGSARGVTAIVNHCPAILPLHSRPLQPQTPAANARPPSFLTTTTLRAISPRSRPRCSPRPRPRPCHAIAGFHHSPFHARRRPLPIWPRLHPSPRPTHVTRSFGAAPAPPAHAPRDIIALPSTRPLAVTTSAPRPRARSCAA